MATKKSERIKIWLITVIMLLGTGVSLVAMGLSLKNSQTDQEKYQKAYSEYMKAVNDQTKTLSEQYYPILNEYSSRVGVFDANSVKELVKEDLLVGDGEEVTAESQYSAYYIGWNPEGEIFDQSISEGELKAPLAGGNMIEGWNQGIVCMKFGGVRELSIPSELAYGSSGSGEYIPADTPIKFVVLIIPKVEDVEVPQVLLDYYS